MTDGVTDRDDAGQDVTERDEVTPEPEPEPAPEVRSKPVVRPERQRPVMPTAREAAAEIGDRPPPAVIRWGFYLIVAAVLISLFGAIYLMLNKETLVSNALEFDNGDRDLTREEVESSVTNGLWVFLVINVVFGVFQALFAYKAMEGQRRARMLVTIVTVMVVLFHFMLVPTLFGQLAGMISAIAAALLYMPASRTFYPPRQPLR
ncbi:hypothetical protein BU204_20480 [Actinophytocola xanthii]|uniref:Uncharacterized protein n=1 Tax=Actinophytocola xanthii TaxID=1912961 RepID=A0A1Q8CN44_9PSEU|nr:hypothetical protein BU204_20480 [Actinophytocola xanthii]